MSKEEDSSGEQSNPKIEVVSDSEKLWGWNTDSWDLPEGLVTDLGLDKTEVNTSVARDWGWGGW